MKLLVTSLYFLFLGFFLVDLNAVQSSNKAGMECWLGVPASTWFSFAWSTAESWRSWLVPPGRLSDRTARRCVGLMSTNGKNRGRNGKRFGPSGMPPSTRAVDKHQQLPHFIATCCDLQGSGNEAKGKKHIRVEALDMPDLFANFDYLSPGSICVFAPRTTMQQ